jgi:hypothetical protein
MMSKRLRSAATHVNLGGRLDKSMGFSYDSAVHLRPIFPQEIEYFWDLMQRDELDYNHDECDHLSRSSS